MIFGESPRATARQVSAPASPARRSFLAQLGAILSAFALFALAGCGGGGGGDDNGNPNPNPSPNPSGSGSSTGITGRVLDRNGGDRPVAGAVIRYRTFSATSDAAGNFRIPVTGGLQAGTVTVVGPAITGANGVQRAGYYGTVVYQQQSFGPDGFTIAANTNNLGDLLIYNTDGPPPPPRF